MSKENPVVILGGGIIGLSVAYYLSESPSFNRQIYIIDSASTLLESASGYAGGFIARDWFDRRVAGLGELSFNLHRELAESFDGQRRWGYCGSHVYNMSLDNAHGAARGTDWLLAGTSRAEAVGRKTEGHVSAPGEDVNSDGTPAWITPQDEASWDVVAGAEDCAQLDPRKLCEFLLGECRKRGVKFLLNTRATEIVTESGNFSTLKLESSTNEQPPLTLRCSDLLIAAGCWSPRVFKTLFAESRVKLEISALAGHSLLYKTPRYTKPFRNIVYQDKDRFHGKDPYISYAIYCPPTKHWSYSPEAYARLNADGKPEIWVGGLNHDESRLPLPEFATDSKKLIKIEDIAELRRTATHMTGLKREDGKLAEDDLEIIKEGLCFRPISKSGIPIIGGVSPADLGLNFGSQTGAKIWIASGHGPWGIAMALGTGVLVTDLITEQKPRIDISALRVSSHSKGSKL